MVEKTGDRKMKNQKESLYITKQWAIVYCLLFRTNAFDSPFTKHMLPEPTVLGFRRFVSTLRGFIDLENSSYFQKRVWDLINPDLIAEPVFDMLMQTMFLDLRRIRMSNKFHSRLNAFKPGEDSFIPIEGWPSIKLLNTPGVFNMNNLIYDAKRMDIQSLEWFMNNQNRVLIDNGAFNRAYYTSDFKSVISLYGALEQDVKQGLYAIPALKQQKPIILGSLYSKLTLVAPDKPQSASETMKLIEFFEKVLKKSIKNSDIIFAVQIDQNEKQLSKMIEAISHFGETKTNAIIGLALSNPTLRSFHKNAIPFIVSQCEDKLNPFMMKEMYSNHMNTMLKYTGVELKVSEDSPTSHKAVRFHLLGNSFGMVQQQILLNICISNVLVKEMGMRCLQFSDDHIEMYRGMTREEQVIFIGTGSHPEVVRHLVSSDSSTWVGAVSSKAIILCPITGRQIRLKQRTSITESVNKSFKINMALIASKTAESSFYNCLWVDKVGEKTLQSAISGHRELFSEEMAILASATKEDQFVIRNNIKNKLKKTRKWY